MPYQVIFFDLDGTFHLGGIPFPGLPDLVGRCAREAGVRMVAVTNNTSVVPQAHVAKLERMGLPAGAFELCSPLDVVADCRGSSIPNLIYPVVPAPVADYLRSAGFDLAEEGAEAVLIGFDVELTYSKLEAACRLVTGGSALYATHIDIRCPTTWGYVPDCGAITRMIERSTGQPCSGNFGKPSQRMADYLRRTYCSGGEKAVMIGDRLYTDILLGERMGIDTALVLSGESKIEDIEAPGTPQPTTVFESFEQLLLRIC